MRYLLPQGIGDSSWALTKIQDIEEKLGDGNIEVYLAAAFSNAQEDRAVEFIKRFDFVKKCETRKVCIHPTGSPHIGADGIPVLLDSMLSLPEDGIDCTLMPNPHIDRGLRISEWLPQFKINWEFAKQFKVTLQELEFAKRFRDEIGPYCTFYFGPEGGNTTGGHNRGPLWTPEDWITLGNRIWRELGIMILCIGAEYDKSYWDNQIMPRLGYTKRWIQRFGIDHIGQTVALIRNSRFMVSYQSGMAVFPCYMGVPTVGFWRPKGDSIIEDRYFSLEESAADAWVPYSMLADHKYMGRIYTKCSANSIFEEIKGRGW